MTGLNPANLFGLDGRIALVTGGGSGIGAMIAEGFLGAGARVIIASRKQAQLDGAVERLSDIGPVEAIVADLSSEQGCLDLAEAVGEHTERLDILVNNAGATWGAPLREFPDSAWDRVLNLNVKGVWHLTVALLPLLEAAATPDHPARVINLGSVQGLHAPDIENYSYSAAKAAVHHMSRVMAKKLGRHHITVNAIAPGAFHSKMMAKTLNDMGDEISAATALGRLGRPEDMAGVALFLSGRGGSYLTGAVIPVDGGYVTTL
ncbi:SDR family oxidoreductase [Candidatus Poriferisocius sp.]|uniref:SDR family oxidoreductase n=1 Tax=Candidatus Poriferisocius sp. TaxID=3101276 RepID=UPI003B01FC03